MDMQSASTVPQLGELLRYWRQERGKSQIDLSLDTGISQRHLSFVESLRSAPSREYLYAAYAGATNLTQLALQSKREMLAFAQRAARCGLNETPEN